MKGFLKRNQFILIVLIIFLVSELFVNPIGNFPLNDDWSYSKSVYNWQQNGVYNIGDWPAMTLFTHLLWGMVFTKLAGFSFFVLRISTLVSSLIGICLLFKLIEKISHNTRVAFLGSLVLLFNPIYFNLSNTYMTDISFSTLFLLSCYFAYDFFQNGKFRSFILVFIVSVFLVLTRQFGIVVPFAFSLACLRLTQRKWIYFSGAVALTAGTVLVLHLYENYLHQILPPGSAYKFSESTKPLTRIFWDTLYLNAKQRHATLLLHFMVYTLPFSILFLISLFRGVETGVKIAVSLAAAGITYLIFRTEPFPMGNVFVNVGVGTRTFYEYLSINSIVKMEHASSQKFEDAMHWVKLILITLNCTVILLGLLKMRTLKMNFIRRSSTALFFIVLTVTYSLMLLITESYFDRYHLPLIALGILLFSYFTKLALPNFQLSSIFVAMIFYVAVAGTRDYFQINTIRWQAYHDLIQVKKVAPEKINGGMEVNCWNEGRYCFWYTFLELKGFDYLIQFSQEPGFRPYKAYQFQRYFPFEKDKIYIFARDSISAATYKENG